MKRGIYFHFDYSLPKEYNLSLLVIYILAKDGLINIYELNESINELRKQYSLPILESHERKNSNTSND